MDFSGSVKRRKRASVEGGKYERRFQLYLYPPTDDITLEQFEELAITRQKRKYGRAVPMHAVELHLKDTLGPLVLSITERCPLYSGCK